MKKNIFLHTKWDLCLWRLCLACCLALKQNTMSSTFNSSRCFITMAWSEIWEGPNKTTWSLQQHRRVHKNIFSNKDPQTEKQKMHTYSAQNSSFFLSQEARAALKPCLPLGRGYAYTTAHSFGFCAESANSHCFMMVSWG